MNYQKPVKPRNLALFIVILAFSACENSGGDDPVKALPDIVYIVGNYGNFACYWKSKERANLPIPAGRYSEASSIAIGPNGAVYIAGIYGNTACYWENGAHADLPVPNANNINSSASCITVAPNGDVYITGSYGVFISGGSYVACYWLNGLRNRLSVPSESRFPEANSIAVTAKGDVYIAGGYDEDAVNKACYWKNGLRIDLPVPAGTTYAEANSIVVSSKGDVYVAGYYGNSDISTACYWKNNARTDLSGGGASTILLL